jgi:hypothetical protein
VGVTEYIDRLDRAQGVALLVWFETSRDDVTNYALVLVVRDDGRFRTARVYDGAHGQNEMHRYTRKLGKQPAEVFHRGTLGEGMRTAIDAVRDGYREVIEGWRRG